MAIENNLLKYLLLVTLLAGLGAFKMASAYDCDAQGYSPPTNYFCGAPVGGSNGSVGGSAKQTENRIYSGFVWELFGDQGLIPDFIIGFRSLEVKDNDNVSGADLSFRIKYQDKLSPDSLRLAYVGGKRDIMGNVGAGYSFTNSSWLGTAAIQGPYTRLSTDYLFADNKFRYYAEVNTLDKPAEVVRVTRPGTDGTCDSVGMGTVLTVVNNGQIDGHAVDPTQIVNGKTCYL